MWRAALHDDERSHLADHRQHPQNCGAHGPQSGDDTFRHIETRRLAPEAPEHRNISPVKWANRIGGTLLRCGQCLVSLTTTRHPTLSSVACFGSQGEYTADYPYRLGVYVRFHETVTNAHIRHRELHNRLVPGPRAWHTSAPPCTRP